MIEYKMLTVSYWQIEEVVNDWAKKGWRVVCFGMQEGKGYVLLSRELDPNPSKRDNQ